MVSEGERARARFEAARKYGVSYGSPMIAHKDSSGRIYYTPYKTSSKKSPTKKKSPSPAEKKSSKKSREIPVYKERKVYVTKYGVYDVETGERILSPPEGKVFDIESVEGKKLSKFKGNKFVILDTGVVTTVTYKGYRKLRQIKETTPPSSPPKKGSVAIKTNKYSELTQGYKSSFKSEVPTDKLNYEVKPYGVVYTSDVNKFRSITIRKPSESEIRESYSSFMKKYPKQRISYEEYKKLYEREFVKKATSPEIQKEVYTAFLKTKEKDVEYAKYRQEEAKQYEIKKRIDEMYESSNFKDKLAVKIATSPFTADYKTYGAYLSESWKNRKAIMQSIFDRQERLKLREVEKRLREREAKRSLYESAVAESSKERIFSSPFVTTGIAYSTGVLGGATLTAATMTLPPLASETVTAGSIVAGTVGAERTAREWEESTPEKTGSKEASIGRKFQIASGIGASLVGFSAGSKLMKNYLSTVVEKPYTEVVKKPTKIKIKEGKIDVRPDMKYNFNKAHADMEYSEGYSSVLSRLKGSMTAEEKVVFHPKITRADVVRGKIYTILKGNKLLNKLNWKENPLPKPEVVKTFRVENMPIDVKSASNIKFLDKDTYATLGGRQTIRMKIGDKTTRTWKTNIPKQLTKIKTKIEMTEKPKVYFEESTVPVRKFGIRIHRTNPYIESGDIVNLNKASSIAGIEKYGEAFYNEPIETPKFKIRALKLSETGSLSRDVSLKVASMNKGSKLKTFVYHTEKPTTPVIKSAYPSRAFRYWDEFVNSEPIKYWFEKIESPPLQRDVRINVVKNSMPEPFSVSSERNALLLETKEAHKSMTRVMHNVVKPKLINEEIPPAIEIKEVNVTPYPMVAIKKQNKKETKSKIEIKSEKVRKKPKTNLKTKLKTEQEHATATTEKLMLLSKLKTKQSQKQQLEMISQRPKTKMVVPTEKDISQQKEKEKQLIKSMPKVVPLPAVKSMVETKVRPKVKIKISPKVNVNPLMPKTIQPITPLTPTTVRERPPLLPTKFGRLVKVTTNKKRLKLPKPKTIKPKQIKLFRGLLPDELSILKSTVKYGKATPLPAKKSWKIGKKTLYQIIPTKEELKNKKRRKRRSR